MALDIVDTTALNFPQRRSTALNGARQVGLFLEPADDVDCVAADERRVRLVERFLQGR
jgi:hypothetical protein